MIFNDYLNTGVALFFMLAVVVIISASAREWYMVMAGKKTAESTEVPFAPTAAAVAGD